MIISHSNKFVYVRSQKTGSTSVQKFLLQYCNENDFLYIARKQNEYKKHNLKIISTDHAGDHATIDYILDKFEEVKDYKFITSVRHPFDVELSRFKYRGGRSNFSESLKNQLNEPRYNQLNYIFDSAGNCKIDYFIKLENFEHDLEDLCKSFNWEYKPLDKIHNQSHNKKVKFSEDDKKIVFEFYKKIYELLGYQI